MAILLFMLGGNQVKAQQFHQNNQPIVIKANQDTMLSPFAGGFANPQFLHFDIDLDGKMDLLIFDRGDDQLLPFLNRTEGEGIRYQYQGKYRRLFPDFERSLLSVDYDRDGRMDLFSSYRSEETGTFTYQVHRNTSTADSLQLQLAYQPLIAEYISYTSDFWTFPIDIPIFEDVDGDGDIDVLQFSIFGDYVHYFKNHSQERGYGNDSIILIWEDQCWGKFKESAFDNEITLGATCNEIRKTTSSAKHSGATMSLFDYNGDGDFDLFLGDIEYNSIVHLENGKSDFNHFRDTMISQVRTFPEEDPIDIENFPATFFLDVDNDGVQDLVVAPQAMQVSKNLDQVWYYKNHGEAGGQADFKLQKKGFLQDEMLDFGGYSHPVLVDFDGDGDLDLIVAHAGEFTENLNETGQLDYYENIQEDDGVAVFVKRRADLMGLSNRMLNGLAPSFQDLNDNGLPDLVIGSANGRLMHFENLGLGEDGHYIFELQTESYASIDVGSYSTPTFGDLNDNGKVDLLVGDASGRVHFYPNEGTKDEPIYNNGSIIEGLARNRGGQVAPTLADISGDGSLDLLLGRQFGFLDYYQNFPDQLDRNVFERTTDYMAHDFHPERDASKFGRFINAAAGDLDGDGLPDLMLGNFKGGLIFLGSSDVYREVPFDRDLTSTNSIPTQDFAIKAYPNPVSERLQVEIKSENHLGNEPVYLILRDVNGRITKQYQIKPDKNMEKDLNFQYLNSGLYILEVKHATHQSFHKIIKK